MRFKIYLIIEIDVFVKKTQNTSMIVRYCAALRNYIVAYNFYSQQYVITRIENLSSVLRSLQMIP